MVNQKKSKILYLITKSVWGGAGKYVYDLATALPKDKFTAFVAAGGNDELAQKVTKSGTNYHNIKNFQRDVAVFKDVFALFEIAALLFRIRPDVIHVSSSKAGGIAGPAILIYKLFAICHWPFVIFTAHGWAFAEDRPKWQIFLIKIFSWLTCLFYNKIICVSEFDRQLAIKYKIASKKKLITIHNGIKPEDYNFLTKEVAKEKLKISEEFCVGTIGEDTPNKGHKYLKMAFKGSVIISNLPQGYNYLKAFDIFILPSIKEGLPYIILEAGLARVPVIATNVGGIPEIIENQKTGLLVEPKKPGQIREAVEKLANDQQLRNELSSFLWEKIIREFNFEKMLNTTLAAYEKNYNSGK